MHLTRSRASAPPGPSLPLGVTAARPFISASPAQDDALRHPRDHFPRRAELLGAIFPPAPLNLAVGEALRPDGNAKRNADQIGILEFDARTLIAIIEKSIDPGVQQLAVDILRGRADIVFAADLRDENFERRDRHRPDDARIIVTQLDRGGHGASDSEAVAAHDHRLSLSAFVEIRAVHRIGVLRAELENVADLDAAIDL